MTITAKEFEGRQELLELKTNLAMKTNELEKLIEIKTQLNDANENLVREIERVKLYSFCLFSFFVYFVSSF